MLILGIGDHVSCGSSLVLDGKVIAATNDERLVREKMVFGLPRESIKKNLEITGLSAENIDAVAVASINQHFIDGYQDYRDGWFGSSHRSMFKKQLFNIASSLSKLRGNVPYMDGVYYALRKPAFKKRREQIKRILKEELGIKCPVHFLDHHFCHITSAYYTSGYDEATVVSIDGGGDGKSARIYEVSNGQFKELVSISSFDSIGCFYSYVTQICGFKAGKHEGKITGMAAYGEPSYIPQLEKNLVRENGTVKNIANVLFLSALKEFETVLPKAFSHKDLSSSIQLYTEDMVAGLVQYWVEKSGKCNVALAGGTFANVRINQRVHEIPGVKSVYIHPGMSDEGLPVGAAIALNYSLGGKKYDCHSNTMEHVYLGPEYSEEEIATELEKRQANYSKPENLERAVAERLAEGAVVARFNGRMEYGPRALGNRTILYQATDSSVKYWLNDALKRTEFMPFAPIVMDEYAEKCFEGLDGARDTARFMTITFYCTEWMREKCPGVVHIDNTARPQLVDEEDNPGMYRILSEYNKITGLPVLINTSFNMHEEPIVCSPYDAIRAFELGHLDYLAIGPFLAKSVKLMERIENKKKFHDLINKRGFS